MAPYINDHRDNVIRNIALYADDRSFCFKCDQAFDLWQKLELVFELGSNPRDTVDWGKSGLLISVLEKINSFRLIGLITLLLF